jgi:hypothetical protein
LLFLSTNVSFKNKSRKLKLVLGTREAAVTSWTGWSHHYLCHSLDLECPPKAHVLQGWSQPVALLGGSGTFRSQRKVGVFSRWGIVGLGSLLFFQLLVTKWTALLLHALLAMMHYTFPQAQSDRANGSQTADSKTMSHSDLFLFISWFISGT